MSEFLEGMEPPLFAQPRDEEQRPRLTIERADLQAGLRVLGRLAKKSSAGEGLLRLEGADALFEVTGASAFAQASGHWPGEARFSGAFLLTLARALPPSDPVEIRVEDGRLHIATASTKCVWQSVDRPRIELPLDPPDGALLSAVLRHGDEAIQMSGLRSLVERARRGKMQAVEKAARSLGGFGVTEDDLHSLVDQVVLKKWRY